MSISYSLTIIKGGKVGQSFQLDRQMAALGRHTAYNDIILNDPYISSRHARIIFNSGQFYLEDLGSTNKTFVNGVALIPNKPVAITDGMDFTLGKTTFRFQYKATKKRPITRKKNLPQNKKRDRKSRKNGNKKMLHLTPIMLGILLWAVVVIVFLIVTMNSDF
jgi:pSer/pThr/pTyr-binding forkhead associated (FHA) protein